MLRSITIFVAGGLLGTLPGIALGRDPRSEPRPQSPGTAAPRGSRDHATCSRSSLTSASTSVRVEALRPSISATA
jgi:hypothetical protein